MRKILVIDDEKPTLAMFRLFLAAYGYEVLTAENGFEGIEIFKVEKPPMVITDIKMPGMDGFEVLKRIKQLDQRAEVIVITGHGDMDLAIQALNNNATDFINKPIQKTALDAALNRAEERLRMSEARESEIALRTAGEVKVIEIRGNLTSRSEPELLGAYRAICADGTLRVVMNFDESSSVNGAGIAVLIQILSETKKRGQKVAICGLSENFKKVFDMVGITKFAKLYNTEQEAVDSLLQK